MYTATFRRQTCVAVRGCGAICADFKPRQSSHSTPPDSTASVGADPRRVTPSLHTMWTRCVPRTSGCSMWQTPRGRVGDAQAHVAPRCGKRWASQGRPRQVDRMAGRCETGVACSQAQIRWRTGRLWLQQPRGRGAAGGSRHKGEEALHTRPGARGAAGGVNQMPASRLCLAPPQACSPTGPRPLRRGAGAPRAAAGPGAAARHEWVQAGRWGGAGSGLPLSSDWPSSVC